jgi:hypothetical protein
LRHEEDLVDERRRYPRIRDTEQRGRVDHHIVVGGAELVDQVPHLLAAEQIRRIGGLALDGKVIQAGLVVVLDHFLKRLLASHVLDEPGGGREAELALDAGMAQVQIDEEHALR